MAITGSFTLNGLTVEHMAVLFQEAAKNQNLMFDPPGVLLGGLSAKQIYNDVTIVWNKSDMLPVIEQMLGKLANIK